MSDRSPPAVRVDPASLCPYCGDDLPGEAEGDVCPGCGRAVNRPAAAAWCRFAHGSAVRGGRAMMILFGGHLLGVLTAATLMGTLPGGLATVGGVIGWAVPALLGFRHVTRPPRPGLDGPYQVRAGAGGVGGRHGFGTLPLTRLAAGDRVALVPYYSSKSRRTSWQVRVERPGQLSPLLDATFEDRGKATAFFEAVQVASSVARDFGGNGRAG